MKAKQNTTRIKRKPQFVDEYIDGIDPAKRLRHRGVLRNFEYPTVELKDQPRLKVENVPDYIRWLKEHSDTNTDRGTISTIGDLQPDGYFYFYVDEYVSQASSIHEAATFLNRNRSTINEYCKRPDFPAERDIKGNWSIDVIAAQDWILWNTEHVEGLEPYWPELPKGNKLIVLDVDEAMQDDPLYILYDETDCNWSK